VEEDVGEHVREADILSVPSRLGRD
jgi:hypothetical protein